MQSLLIIAFLVGAHAAEKACNGLEVDKPTGTDNPVNEPCYVHDGMCEGYAVCCVKYGTCTATISSNELYYEGGCWSAQSSKGSLREGCTRQGECMAPFLEEVMGGAAAPGKANTLSADKLASMKDVSCAGTDPSAGRLGITIGAIAAVLVVIVLLVVGLVVLLQEEAGRLDGAEGQGRHRRRVKEHVSVARRDITHSGKGEVGKACISKRSPGYPVAPMVH